MHSLYEQTFDMEGKIFKNKIDIYCCHHTDDQRQDEKPIIRLDISNIIIISTVKTLFQ